MLFLLFIELRQLAILAFHDMSESFAVPLPKIPQIHVYPADHPKASAAVTATHTKKAAEGQQSRKERRKATYSPRKATLAVAQVAAPVSP